MEYIRSVYQATTFRWRAGDLRSNVLLRLKLIYTADVHIAGPHLLDTCFNFLLGASSSWLLLQSLLDVCHTLLQDLLQELGVLQLLADLGNNAVGQFPLLSHLNLTLVSYPAVENGLCFGGKGSLLFEFESLSFEFGGFLFTEALAMASSLDLRTDRTHLANSEKVLGDVHHVGQWLHILNTGLDSLSMSLPCRVQNVLESLNSVVGPLLVHGPTILEDTVENSE